VTAAEFIYTVLLRPRPLRSIANWALRRIIKPELHIHGCMVALNPNDPVISGALTLGKYENAEAKFFRAACRPGMTFLDVGANIGYYTAQAMRRVGSGGQIIAMEPDPESFSYLKKTVALNGDVKVTCVPLAASTQTGEATLYISHDNRGDNRLYANELSSGSVEVRTVVVDDLLAELGISEVNLVKIDVQGYEGHVLRSMEGTLSNSSSVIVMMEFWPQGLHAAGFEPKEIFEFCARLNFRMFKITEGGKLEPVTDSAALIRDYSGRKYTSLVAARVSDSLEDLIA
jgi:FkbM family methyltransferase